jgi:hypothetical protein
MDGRRFVMLRCVWMKLRAWNDCRVVHCRRAVSKCWCLSLCVGVSCQSNAARMLLVEAAQRREDWISHLEQEWKLSRLLRCGTSCGLVTVVLSCNRLSLVVNLCA